MIKDVPTSADFESASIGALHLAFDIAYELESNKQVSEIESWDDDGTVTDQYWDQAQRPLGNAIGLLQQSHELGLKGRIAEISPYILLAQEVRQWPSNTPGGVPFSRFRSIDAVDLVKVHDLFCTDSLTDDFKNLYERTRQLRNILTHGVAKAERITALDVLKQVLTTFRSLYPSLQWAASRLEYLSNNATAVLYSSDHSYALLLFELEFLTDELTRAELDAFFNFHKKQRHYICPGQCYQEMTGSDEFAARQDRLVRLAELSPNDPSSREVFCFVCNRKYRVNRAGCRSDGCKSNVIAVQSDETDPICLLCGHEQAD